MKVVATQRGICLGLGPRLPSGAITRNIFQADAIYRAHRNAKLAAGTNGFYHRVHELVAAHNRVSGANRQTQGAADTPVLIDDSNEARAFSTVCRVQGDDRQTGDGSQALHAFRASRRALVNAGCVFRNRLRVGRTVGVAASGALRLRQCSVDARFESSYQASTFIYTGRNHQGIVARLPTPAYPLPNHLPRAVFFAGDLAGDLAGVRAAGLAAALTGGDVTHLVTGLLTGLVNGVFSGLSTGLPASLTFNLGKGLINGLTEAWTATGANAFVIDWDSASAMDLVAVGPALTTACF